MNDDMKFKNEYKEMFKNIHAPETLDRKVKNMTRLEVKKFGLHSMKKVAVAAAFAGVLFVGSNGIAYAATGSTWLETIVVHFNGSDYKAILNETNDEENISYTIIEEQETE